MWPAMTLTCILVLPLLGCTQEKLSDMTKPDDHFAAFQTYCQSCPANTCKEAVDKLNNATETFQRQFKDIIYTTVKEAIQETLAEELAKVAPRQ
ncbi:hypothetical protein DSUL_20425 [Desulfovibrionales bacterium]